MASVLVIIRNNSLNRIGTKIRLYSPLLGFKNANIKDKRKVIWIYLTATKIKMTRSFYTRPINPSFRSRLLTKVQILLHLKIPRSQMRFLSFQNSLKTTKKKFSIWSRSIEFLQAETNQLKPTFWQISMLNRRFWMTFIYHQAKL